jgi:hypothetical protein
MDIDFTKLDGRQFEMLCGSLLAVEGFLDLHQFGKLGEPDHGIDWIFFSPDGKRMVAQVRAFRRPVTSPSILRIAVESLLNGLTLVNAEKGVLMLSVPIAAAKRVELL